MIMVIKPSKKKMLRQVWIGAEFVPHRGISERSAAKRPPKEFARELDAMNKLIRRNSSFFL